MTRYLKIEHHSISDRGNFDEIHRWGWKRFIEEGERSGCFGPIRLGAAEPSLPEDLERYSIVVHMRDPRDVLTSLFFSHVYSHARGTFDPGDEARTRWKEMGIDRFVLHRAVEGPESFRSRYELFCSRLYGRENVLLLRYEDLVSDYPAWLGEFLTVFSDWTEAPGEGAAGGPRSPEAVHRRYCAKFEREFEVPAEDVYRHKRQVAPGDHRRKLRPETIAELDSIFAESLARLGYS